MGSAPTSIVDFEQALQIVLTQAKAAPRSSSTQNLPLLEAQSRVLAAGLLTDHDQPPFDRSTRDGFALRATDWTPEAGLEIIGQLRAGQLWSGPTLAPNQAIEIMTGAPIPPGADAVLMVEHATRSGTTLTPNTPRTLTAGENIVPRGSEARVGTQVVPAGTRIGPAEIALAATCGRTHLEVTTRPTVAILATGDELVELAEKPALQQIRNSNSYSIAAMVAAAGGTPLRLPIARDLREDIHNNILAARSANLLILSGGVSMGEYDLVEEVLTTFGAEFFFTGVRMQPGKPVVFGRLPARDEFPELFFFGLPGNPISTQVTFHCFAELFLRVLAGEPNPAPKWALATLTETISAKPGLTRLLPARLEGTAVTTTPWQGSGDLAANARANCYAEFKPNHPYAPGDTLRILLR
jgi:molybdopterin molybdotransferase